MMSAFREDVLLIIPAYVLLLIQTTFFWRGMPEYREEETEIEGEYNLAKRFQFIYIQYLIYLVIIIQFAIPLLPVIQVSSSAIWFPLLGYLLLSSGVVILIIALWTLGSNWTGMFHYRIKKKQILVTKGIYGIIRNPIYLAEIIEIAGLELILNSWLFILLTLIVIVIFSRQAKKEEVLLEKKFGKTFLLYKDHVASFMPFIY